MELQADCFAGVWAHSTTDRQVTDEADIKGGLQAAAAVGDDRMQKMSRGYVTPDSFTHGSSEQRVSWFTRGFPTGQVRACNTFAVDGLAFTSTLHSQAPRSAAFLEEKPRRESLLCIHQK